MSPSVADAVCGGDEGGVDQASQCIVQAVQTAVHGIQYRLQDNTRCSPGSSSGRLQAQQWSSRPEVYPRAASPRRSLWGEDLVSSKCRFPSPGKSFGVLLSSCSLKNPRACPANEDRNRQANKIATMRFYPVRGKRAADQFPESCFAESRAGDQGCAAGWGGGQEQERCQDIHQWHILQPGTEGGGHRLVGRGQRRGGTPTETSCFWSVNRALPLNQQLTACIILFCTRSIPLILTNVRMKEQICWQKSRVDLDIVECRIESIFDGAMRLLSLSAM